MDPQVKEFINARIDEFDKLTDSQLILAGLARLISANIPPDASFQMAVGDLSLMITMLVRAGGNKEEAIKYMFPEVVPANDEQIPPEVKS